MEALAHPLLGVVTDGTRIQQDKVCFFDVPRRRVAGVVENARDDFRVAEVHLAPVTL
jgi:hypothetical protein